MEIAILAALLTAAVVFQSVILFRLHERAQAAQRADTLQVLLAQANSFESALAAVQATQSVGGTPLQLAIAHHEGNVRLSEQNAQQNYDLAKIDAELRQRSRAPQRPTVVAASAAHGD